MLQRLASNEFDVLPAPETPSGSSTSNKAATPAWRLLLYALGSLLLGASPLLAAINGPDIMVGVLIFVTMPIGLFFGLAFSLAAVLRMIGGWSSNERSPPLRK